MTVAIYARKSVERQDSVSIDTQIEECKTKVPKKVNTRTRDSAERTPPAPTFSDCLKILKWG